MINVLKTTLNIVGCSMVASSITREVMHMKRLKKIHDEPADIANFFKEMANENQEETNKDHDEFHFIDMEPLREKFEKSKKGRETAK